MPYPARPSASVWHTGGKPGGFGRAIKSDLSLERPISSETAAAAAGSAELSDVMRPFRCSVLVIRLFVVTVAN